MRPIKHSAPVEHGRELPPGGRPTPGGIHQAYTDRLVRVSGNWRSAIRRCTTASLAGQGPKPAATLMCPSGPAFTNSVFQISASSRARAKVIYGSLVLATVTAGNGSGTRGIGAKLRRCSGVCPAESTSAGATSSAEPIGRAGYSRAAWATRMHPRLCATRTAPGASATAPTRRASHLSRCGRPSRPARRGLCREAIAPTRFANARGPNRRAREL
jgi:hypothetical protein